MNQKSENRRITYTKRVLKESLLTLLTSKPLAKITVSELTEMADVNRSTFYAHYNDIFALAAEIQRETAQDAIAVLDRLYQSQDYQENVLNGILDLFLYHKEMRIWLLDSHFSEQGNQILYDYAKKRILPVWEAKGGLTPEQSEWFYAFLYNGALGFIKQWYVVDFQGNIQQIRQMFSDFVQSSLKYVYP